MGIKYLGRVVGAFVLVSYLAGCSVIQKEFDIGFARIGEDIKGVLELDRDQDGKTTFQRNCEKTKDNLLSLVTKEIE